MADQAMITDLEPYPAMKDSGVEWLGEVPEHWAVVPLKHWVRINDSVLPEDTDADFEFDYLDIGSVGTGILTEKPLRIRFGTAPSRARRVVREGDTLVSTVRTYLKAVWYAENKGGDLIASTGFAVLTPNRNAFHKFIGYLARSKFFTDWVTAESIGIAYPAIAESRLGTFHVRTPPLPEQAAIVRYLDYVDRRVRRLVRAKQKLIGLLEEQKQAIIHRAVTLGLDPDVPLKDSGVEWLGKVPEHWEVTRLKNLANVHTGLTLGKVYKDIETKSYPYLRVANVQTGRVDLQEIKHIDVPLKEAIGAALESQDVLVTEGGDIDKLGRGCIWRNEIPGCLHQNHVFSVRCHQHLLDPEFLVGLMSSQHGRNYFQQTGKQTTNLASTNSTTLRAFPIMLPPLAEQKVILDAIKKQNQKLDTTIDHAHREIELLNEYRTRLVADVVTGKLDVREAAARLPEESDDFDPFNETDNLPEEAWTENSDDIAEESEA